MDSSGISVQRGSSSEAALWRVYGSFYVIEECTVARMRQYWQCVGWSSARCPSIWKFINMLS
jgi:hypothetical protein